MYKASADVVLPTSIIGSLPRPSWYTENLGTRSFLEANDYPVGSAAALLMMGAGAFALFQAGTPIASDSSVISPKAELL